MESLSPGPNRNRSLEKQGAYDVIGSANHALSIVILGRSVGAGYPKLDTMREEEGTRREVIKLSPIVTLNDIEGATELSGHPGEEVRKCGEHIILQTQWESP